MFCGIKSYNVFECCLLVLTQPHSFALRMTHCSKSAQKSADQVCQIATVVTETSLHSWF